MSATTRGCSIRIPNGTRLFDARNGSLLAPMADGTVYAIRYMSVRWVWVRYNRCLVRTFRIGSRVNNDHLCPPERRVDDTWKASAKVIAKETT